MVGNGMAGVTQHLDTGILVEKINHSSGKSEWKIMPADYDYSRELARASFADMLHDSERNRLYRVGLQAAIKKVKARGDKVRVLDIGTGTGLLSMMAAAEEGIESIVACEEFRPMAECASKIIEVNGFKDDIKLVRKRSTELTVGPGCDMEHRANILVTEVFDTELIGEGAIGTYNHANQELLTPNRIVVPGRARMFAQVVSSDLASNWNRLRDIDLGNGDGKKLKFSGRYSIDNLVLHDIQLSQMNLSEFTPLSEPIQVFDFDLACKKSPIPCHDQTKKEFTAVNAGTATAVFMWWDCYTDPDETVLLSCAPFWDHREGQEQSWRDHWMQAVYFPNTEIKINKGEKIELTSNHDEYSLWFDVNKINQDCIKPREMCHLPMSRTRLFEVNNVESNNKYTQALREKICDKVKNILCLGDQTILGLLAASVCTNAQITVVQENRIMRDILHQISEENDLKERVTIVGDIDDLVTDGNSYEAVISDVFFNGSVLSWHNLVFWYHVNQLKQDGRISDNCITLPGCMSVWMVPVHYQHLWKIRAPLHNIEGFDMTHFDHIIDKASTTCDENVEPQPLWEYPCTALAQPTKLLTLSLTDTPVPEHPITYSGAIEIGPSQLDLNGLALWTTWDLTPELNINTGPCSEIKTEEQITWCKGHKQGVHFFKEHSAASRVQYNVTFLPQEGDFKFEFSNTD